MNIDKHIEQLQNGTFLSEKDLYLVCETVKEILLEESNVQFISAPVTVCGDTRGQFNDLLELFVQGGQIPKTKYIFMGSFVDSGYDSVETFQLLMCLKIKYPSHITLLRGNHETRQISNIYGFYTEVMKKYGNPAPWRYCTDVFDYLSIGAIIEGRILCLHGGLTPDIKTIDQIRTIDRIMEVPNEGAFLQIYYGLIQMIISSSEHGI